MSEGPFFQFAVRASQANQDPALLEQRDRELEDYLSGALGNGAWQAPLRLGVHRLWVDATGDLRIKSSIPTSDLDGTVVGTQT